MPHATPVLLPARPATREMLLRSGFSPQMIRTQLTAGRLVRVRRGVFLAASAWPDSPAQRHVVMAWAEQTLYESAVMSHGTAALVWRLPHPGLAEWFADQPTVTLPSDSGSRSRQGGVVHRLAVLPAHHVTRDEAGFSVTTVARTAVDLVPALDLPQALVVLDGAARRLVESMVVEARVGNRFVRWTGREIMREPSGVVGRVVRALGL